MPELPEVETTRRGISPHMLGKKVSQVIIRQAKLRWPIPAKLKNHLNGYEVTTIERRGKYLLIKFAHGSLIMHLGMSGSLRILPSSTPPEKHDHIDIVFGSKCLRLRDPRRFGAVLWTNDSIAEHPLLAKLGPEPLSDAFHGDYLHRRSRGRRVPIKNLIMNSHIVVGVGNIYASEALYAAGIHPQRPAQRISLARYQALAAAIKQILKAAIKQGGTTLKDFQQEDGKPGYFAQQLQVYGRAGETCAQCGHEIKQKTIGQRSSFFCSHCQH